MKKLLIIVSIILVLTGCKKDNVMGKDKDTIIINVNGEKLIVNLENNSSARSLKEKLNSGNITINAHDYGNFEKVGDLGFSLPTNDEKITTTPGDVILYMGNQITIYYDTNTWNFTKLGHINIDKEKLKNILGKGDITFTLEGE